LLFSTLLQASWLRKVTMTSTRGHAICPPQCSPSIKHGLRPTFRKGDDAVIVEEFSQAGGLEIPVSAQRRSATMPDPYLTRITADDVGQVRDCVRPLPLPVTVAQSALH
jgi:hypothetical protein